MFFSTERLFKRRKSMQRVTCIALLVAAVACTSGELGPGADHLVFTSLSAGTGFTCALTGDGAAYCWGANDKGQLGDGTTTDRSKPKQVSTSVRFKTISSGPTHSCALTDNGAAYCWGANDFGKLGSGTAGTAAMTPTAVNGDLRFVSIAAGLNNTCTTTDQRQVYCWGQIAETNQFGDFLPKSTLDPQLIPGSMVAVVAGDDGGYCSVDTAGLAYCWGLFYFFPASGPPVPPIRNPAALTVHFTTLRRGGEHFCGIDPAEHVWCWGRNWFGQVGNGTISDAPAPNQVIVDLTFKAIASGNAFSCGVAAGGKLFCWGLNCSGQLVTGSTSNAPVPQPVLTPVLFTNVSAGFDHACALGADGIIYCWGNNATGQLGVGTTSTGSTTPVPVLGN
jgi:alpha-tubulin suppressor-like RCC1 family protein